MGGNRRHWAVWGGMAAGAVVVGGAAYRPLPPVTAPFRADIHTEYVKFPSGRDTITAYLAYPERKDPAPVVVVIHEIFGMSDFIRQTTEQLAKDGFVAIAPDLLSRRGGTPASPDDARKVIAGLDPDTVTKDLDATVAYVKRIKAARADRVGVIGFCWGGGQSFRYATNNPSLGAFVVCYGPGPDALSIARIRAKGLGVYAENDARINAALEVFTRLLQRRLVPREQVVHRPYHDEMRFHADTGEPRAVGSLVAGDRELHAPALRECERGVVSRTPARRLPDDEAPTGGAERGQQVFRRSGRGARHQRRDRAPVCGAVRAGRNSFRLGSVPRDSGVAQVPRPEHGPILGRSPAHGGERAVGETGENLVGVFGLAVRGAAQVQHQSLHAGEVGKRAVELAHHFFVPQGGDPHDGDATR